MCRPMMFSQIQRFTAILILSVSASALPALAQSSAAKNNDNAGLPAPAAGKVVEEIVARVNDQIITQSDYNRAAEQLDAEARQQGVPAREVEQKKVDLLRDLIDQQLLLSKGKEMGVTGETELIKRLDDIRKQNHLDSMEDLEKAAQQQGVSYEDFKANIRNGIITQQVVRDEVGRRISITPAEAQQYFKAHESEFAQPESVTLNEILIPTPAKAANEGADAADVAAAQAKADAISAKLASGAKFEDQAKPAPTDPNDPKYVVLGEWHRGQLAKEIEDKAFALNPGQYTQPIRTKQGFIILQAAQRNLGGDASYKQVEPQVEEALFMERMQPKLREYLTQLREEAAIDIKPGMVDTGASGNEMHLTYSAYTPPAEKKKKKFARTRFRGKTKTAATETAKAAAPAAGQTAAAGTAPAAAGTTPAAAAMAPGAAGAAPAVASAAPAGQTAPAATQQASNNAPAVEKPGKREKIRFGQAPRESLPPSQVASNADNTPSVTTPETRYVNPDGTVTADTPTQPERKTRLASRPTVHKPKKTNPTDTSDQPTADEVANQKVQNAGLGLTDPNAPKKAKEKVEKTRLANKKPEQEQVQQPYLGKPEPGQPAPGPQPASGGTQPAAPAGNQPATPAPGTPTPPQQ
jgi:peptidyl-prolyl cis-trans isomerase SurA